MKIKDLVWRSDPDFPPTADTPIGSYELLIHRGSSNVTLVFNNVPLLDYGSLDLAKLAARLHFKSIITSCLEP